MTDLEQLLETLDDVSEPGDAPVWVHAYGRAGAGGVLEVDEAMDRIFGWRAPAECWAVGVVAGGWAWPTAPGGERPAWPPPEAGRAARRRVTTLCLVGRDGEVAGRVRFAGGPAVDEAPFAGRMFDALQRCLDLPTAAPQRAPAELLALTWLSEVIVHGRAVAHRRPLSWSEAAALHPAVAALQEDGHPVDSDHFDQVMVAAARAWTWQRLRQLAAGGGWLAAAVPPGLAGWMDEGMFSRWVLDGAAPVGGVVADAVAVLTAPAAERVRRCLAMTGLGAPCSTT